MIHLACSADDGFTPHCATMLRSVYAHLSDETVAVHFLCDALGDQNRQRLQQQMDEQGWQLRIHVIGAQQMQGIPVGRFHRACWYRIFLPELLPDVAQVLYLDADIVAMDSVLPLWQQDLNGQLFAAVTNPLYPFMPNRVATELGIDDPREYLNSGVMLMDLASMRACSLVDQLREYAAKHPDNPWPEQDALSVVCRGKWLLLPARWNAQSTVFELADADLPMSPQELREARQHPALVHFIGPHKPWHFLCRHPLRHQYHVYRRQTPWGESALEGKSLINWLVRPLSLRAQLRLKEWRQLLRGA